MKKFSVVLIGFLTFVSALSAQEKAINEVDPVAMSEIKKSDVPAAVTNAVARDFKNYVPTKFSSFPYQFRQFGWFVNTDNKETLDHYQVNMVTQSGSYLEAVYSPTGDLIRYKQLIKNEALPEVITRSIANSDYKDWTITGDHELIKGNPKEMTDHYVIKLKKGNQKKNLFLDEKGIFLLNK
jgi:hypothetical protein